METINCSKIEKKKKKNTEENTASLTTMTESEWLALGLGHANPQNRAPAQSGPETGGARCLGHRLPAWVQATAPASSCAGNLTNTLIGQSRILEVMHVQIFLRNSSCVQICNPTESAACSRGSGRSTQAVLAGEGVHSAISLTHQCSALTPNGREGGREGGRRAASNLGKEEEKVTSPQNLAMHNSCAKV